MSFREPLALIGLALVPLAILAYWRAQRRRRRYAVRYTTSSVLAGVAGRSWGATYRRCWRCWRSRALLIALARPQRTVAAEQARGDRHDGHRHVGLDAGHRRQARPPGRRAGRRPRVHRQGAGHASASASSRSARAPSSRRSRRPTTRPCVAALDGAEGRGRHGDGRRAQARARRRAHAVPERPRRRRAGCRRRSCCSPTARRPTARPTRCRSPARPARSRSRSTRSRSGHGVRPASTTKNGGQVNGPARHGDAAGDRARLRGQFFDAPNAARLEAVYRNLGTRLAVVHEKREITGAFAGGALLLLVAGGVVSLLRTGRLP